jgi:hypothetical protein
VQRVPFHFPKLRLYLILTNLDRPKLIRIVVFQEVSLSIPTLFLSELGITSVLPRRSKIVVLY